MIDTAGWLEKNSPIGLVDGHSMRDDDGSSLGAKDG